MADETPEERIHLLESKVEVHEERITTHGREIDEMREMLISARADSRHRDESIRRIESKVERTDTKLDMLRQDVLAKPAGQWEEVKRVVLAVALTAVVTYMLGNMGIG